MKRTALLFVFSVMFVFGRSGAQGPVVFGDPYLQSAVESEIGANPMPSDMLELVYLDASSSLIVDLGGLEYAVNLEYLEVHSNWVSDVAPISGLSKLKWLYLEDNLVEDVSGLSGLGGLELLSLDENRIEDVSGLGGLANLSILWLYDNDVNDITPLGGLVNLTEMDLDENPLNTPAYCAHLPVIAVNNPLTQKFVYDGNANPLTSDCATNIGELAEWARGWLDVGCSGANDWCWHADLDHTGNVGQSDFAVFAGLWGSGQP